MSIKKTAVVTGAAGFLGSHLSDRLLAEGYKVVGLDNLLTGNLRNIAHLGSNPDFDFIQHDVTKFIDLPGPVNLIFHFASPASPIDYLQLPIQTLKVAHWARTMPWGWLKRSRRPAPGLDFGDLRRSAGASPKGNLLGERQPGRPSRCV
nr:NAD-dependent epimerase/dehydratase family protein [Verrucomicrobium spinosum]